MLYILHINREMERPIKSHTRNWQM